MDELLRLATIELVRFLGTHLPSSGDEWWEECVVNRLSFQQQRAVEERDVLALDGLDLAALLRVLDQNWYELSQSLRLPREGRTWVKELQTVRNKWAHLSSQRPEPSEVYRDADTLSRLLRALSAEMEAIGAVEKVKAEAFSAMTEAGGSSAPEETSTPISEPIQGAPSMSDTGGQSARRSEFRPGDLVVLKSDPETLMPVTQVMPGGAECQYEVFYENKKAVYYESQLQQATEAFESSTKIDVNMLHAMLTSLQLLSPSTSSTA
jgi:ATP-dependent helicase HepA